METLSPSLTVMLAGLIGGLALGWVARTAKFCTLGAIEDALLGGNTSRLRMWVLAMAVALFGTALLDAIGTIETASHFLTVRPIHLATLIVGGVAFGVGMALVGTCGFGTLVRLGGGDLKSFVVFLVIGISAYMAASGPTAMLKAALLDDLIAPPSWLTTPLLGDLLQEYAEIPAIVTACVIALALLAWVFASRAFRSNLTGVIGGIVVGIVIVWGWFATGFLGADPFEPQPLGSYTFIKPLGASVLYLMASTGTEIGFGVGATLGVLLGSCAAAHARDEFRWEASDDAREQKRQIVGAVLMGTGGMFALGCTIGQGLTAVSILSVTAPIVLISIWIGAWLGLSFVVEGTVRGAVLGLFARRNHTPNAGE